MSRDKLLSHFCEMPSTWGGKQNTPCLSFAKGLRYFNMVMTFTLTPFSHYNSITEPYAHFLLSYLEDLSFDFPLTLSLLSLMSIRIRWPVISSSFLRLSCRSFATFPSPFLFLLTTPPWVSSTPVMFDKARLNFDRNGHMWSLPILQLLLFHPPLLLLSQLVMWPWRLSWSRFSAWMLALTFSLMSCVRWTPVSVV